MNDANSQPALPTHPLKRRASEQRRVSSTGREPPTTFFFATEDQVQRSLATTAESPVSAESSIYGVQSLSSNLSSAQQSTISPDGNTFQLPIDLTESSEPAMDQASDGADTIEASTQVDHSPVQPPSSLRSGKSSPSKPLPRQISATALAGQLTPLYVYSPAGDTDSAPAGTPKSVSLRSLRLSDDDSAIDDNASQAVTSGDEEEETNDQREDPVFPAYPQDAPQLVMPNLRLPSRRPFTQRGKDIGKLKIMIAGASGVGKTSLIKSIVQVCDDIVHFDPINISTPSIRTSEQRAATRQSKSSPFTHTSTISEILASTRAYPRWWSDLEESRFLRRRQSLGEQVLERNITFLDCPGFDAESAQEPDPAIEYVEACLRRNLDFENLGEAEILNILSGNGGVQVDLAIYMLAGHPTSRDIDNLKALWPQTNTVPVIAKADLHSTEEIQHIKTTIADAMLDAGIETVEFQSVTSLDHTQPPQHRVWAVSSAPGNDNDNMDASLLMSPDYVQPLVSSDFSELIRQIFDPETAAWLRHSAAKKFLRWRNLPAQLLLRPNFDGRPGKASNIYSPSNTGTSILSLPYPHSSNQTIIPPTQRPSSHNNSTFNTHHTDLHIPPLGVPANTYSRAQMLDHTQRQETKAQARLAWWAADLQRSLANERARYDSLHREERKRWLLARFSELSEAEQLQNNDPLRPTIRHTTPSFSRLDSLSSMKPIKVTDQHDPLGLLALDDHIRRNGLVVAKVLGGCGMLGAMVIWVMRTWGPGLGFAWHGSD